MVTNGKHGETPTRELSDFIADNNVLYFHNVSYFDDAELTKTYIRQ